MNAPAPNILLETARNKTRAVPGWLEQRRGEAIKTLETRGIPHRRIEDWKYTDLKPSLDAVGGAVATTTAAWDVEKVPSGVTLFDLARLSTAPEWVRSHLGKAAAAEPMPAASLALAHGGFALHVARGQAIAEPIQVVVSGDGNVRALVVLDEDAQLTLIEEQDGSGAFRNSGLEIVIGANATFTHVRFASAAKSVLVEDVAVRVARGAVYRAHLLSQGSELSRLTLRVTLKEPGASANISGVTVLGGTAHADVTTHVYHASPETQSEQLFKHVVGGRGRAVYQGKITVAEGADKSDSRQTAKALLLGERAEADLKPELEILADDVKCAHGAAVGDLDADSLFYLRARGIPENEARNMLLRAFLFEAVDEIENEDIRNVFWQSVEDALPRAMVSAV